MNRLTALLVALLLACIPAQADDLGNGSWNETDASNTAASPNGWPTGITGAGAVNSGRAMMGATKRFWDSHNATVTSGGSSNAYTYATSNTTYPTALVTGQCFTWKASFSNTSSATLQINSLTAKNLFKQTVSGPAALAGGEIVSGQHVKACYDGTQFQIISAIASTGASGGGLVLIQCKTASSSASLDFTTGISSSYDQYELRGTNILPATDGADLYLRFSQDGGSTWKSGAGTYNYQRQFINSAGTASSTAATSTAIILQGSVENTASGGGVSFRIALANPASTAVAKSIFGDVMAAATDGNFYKAHAGGQFNADTAAINGLQLSQSSGNIASGRACLYGIALS